MRGWYIGWRSAKLYPTPATLRIVEFPWWATIPSDLFDAVDGLFHHRLCNPPTWTFHVPLGFARNEDGWERSLGLAIYELFQWVGFFQDRHQTAEHSVDVTDEWLAANGFGEDLLDEDEVK